MGAMSLQILGQAFTKFSRVVLQDLKKKGVFFFLFFFVFTPIEVLKQSSGTQTYF